MVSCKLKKQKELSCFWDVPAALIYDFADPVHSHLKNTSLNSQLTFTHTYEQLSATLMIVCILKDVTGTDDIYKLIEALNETKKEIIEQNSDIFVDFLTKQIYKDYPLPFGYEIWIPVYSIRMNCSLILAKNYIVTNTLHITRKINTLNHINKLLHLCYNCKKQERNNRIGKKIKDYEPNKEITYKLCQSTFMESKKCKRARTRKNIKGPKTKYIIFKFK